ncbi:hypothetical protein JYU15_02115, partial [bacterium AH-315-I18]|nr:hypothetical protein [bacterium AH-315-I18]
LWRDESARIPMMMRGPGIATGVVSEQVASLVDVAPTLLSFAATDTSAHMQGQDLSSVLRGDVQTLEHNYAIIESGEQGIAIRTPEHVLGRYWVKGTEHRKVHDQVGECFDMKADPFSLNNLADSDTMPANWETLNKIITDFDTQTPWLELPPFKFGRKTV